MGPKTEIILTLVSFEFVPLSPPGYVPVTAPAYFTVGSVRVTEKFFAYAAVGVVSQRPSFMSSLRQPSV